MNGKSWWKFINKIIIKPLPCVATLSYEVEYRVFIISKLLKLSLSRILTSENNKILALVIGFPSEYCQQVDYLIMAVHFKGKENQL